MQHLPLSRLIFVDETWIKTNMTRLCGWAPGGERLRDQAPFGHWKTLTFMGGLKADRIIAPWVLDHAINGTSFMVWVTKCLVPALSPGEIVLMDRLSSHKMAAVRTAIRAAGAKLWFLPPYSPDLNPIEQAFSKLKTLFRKTKARTIDDACEQIGRLLNDLPAKECEAFIRNVGYGVPT
jgi:transposase